MSAKTKIVVLRMKELICAGIFAGIGLILIGLLILLFLPETSENSNKETSPTLSDYPETERPAASSDLSETEKASAAGILQESASTASYRPGIYKTELILGGQSLELEAVLTKDHIESLRFVNLDEAITTMYPLLQPTMDHICEQVYETQSLDHITYESGAKYTSMVLLEAIRNCLQKGSLPAED